MGNGPAVRATTLARSMAVADVRWESTGPRRIAAVLHLGADRGPRLPDPPRQHGRPACRASAGHDDDLDPARRQRRKPEGRQARIDARDIRSREVGVDLAFEAFASQPARGIGWGRFPEYSTANSAFSGLPTHNEYLRFLAELGILGVGLLVLAGLVVASTFWRRPLDAMSLALLGMLVAGAVGLVFVNGLVAAAIAVPLGFAAALACARAGPREVAVLAEASDWWRAGRGGGASRPRWPDPARIAAAAVAAVDRIRAAAPRPAPAHAGRPIHGIADGLTHLRDASPAQPRGLGRRVAPDRGRPRRVGAAAAAGCAPGGPRARGARRRGDRRRSPRGVGPRRGGARACAARSRS